MQFPKNPFAILVAVMVLLTILVTQNGCAAGSANPVDRLAAQDRIIATVGGAAIGAGIGAIDQSDFTGPAFGKRCEHRARAATGTQHDNWPGIDAPLRLGV